MSNVLTTNAPALPERFANPLRLIAGMLAARTRIGGRIVLSGILAEQAEELVAIYSQWFEMQPAVEEAGWLRLSGVRHS